jgi:hypothetical protein
MLLAKAVVGETHWFLQLLVMAAVGVVAYLPALLVFGLVPGERIALTNGLAKVRGRPAAG